MSDFQQAMNAMAIGMHGGLGTLAGARYAYLAGWVELDEFEQLVERALRRRTVY